MGQLGPMAVGGGQSQPNPLVYIADHAGIIAPLRRFIWSDGDQWWLRFTFCEAPHTVASKSKTFVALARGIGALHRGMQRVAEIVE